MLVNSSTVSSLQQELERLKVECATLEMTLNEREAKCISKWKDLSELQMAINNLYLRCGVRLREGISVEDKVTELGSRLVDLKFICDSYRGDSL